MEAGADDGEQDDQRPYPLNSPVWLPSDRGHLQIPLLVELVPGVHHRYELNHPASPSREFPSDCPLSPGLGATLRHEWGTRTHGSPISAHHRHPPHHLFETRSGCLVPRRCLENAQGAATLAFGFVARRTALEDHRLGLEERKQPFGSPLASYPRLLEATERHSEVSTECIVADRA